MSVVEAVEREVKALGPRAKGSALAAAALVLAGELEAGNSATSKSMCAKELRECLRELRALAPAKRERDGVDEIARRRERRLGGASASS